MFRMIWGHRYRLTNLFHTIWGLFVQLLFTKLGVTSLKLTASLPLKMGAPHGKGNFRTWETIILRAYVSFREWRFQHLETPTS